MMKKIDFLREKRGRNSQNDRIDQNIIDRFLALARNREKIVKHLTELNFLLLLSSATSSSTIGNHFSTEIENAGLRMDAG